MLSLQTFAAVAREEFDLSIGETAMPMTLVEVKPLPVRVFAGMMREPFSLLFRSASPLVLPQRLYRVRHVGLGAIDMFLVPVARDAQGTFYQAIYN